MKQKKTFRRGLQYCIYKYPALTRRLSDETYLKLMFWVCIGKKLNLKNPQTFNEKMQWLKLYNRNPAYPAMADKYAAKKIIADRIGEEYVAKNYAVWDTADEIDFDILPNQFVIKCTHDCGGMVICRDKSKLDQAQAREKIAKALSSNYYYSGREWPYSKIKPRIIAEEYLEDKKTGELRDYKFFCFGGVCKCMKVDFDRFVNHRANYYDPQGNLLDFGEINYPPDKQKNIVLPTTMDKMTELAERLSKGIPFLRVDFYDVNERIYFGELTFYPMSGFGAFTDDEWDIKLGEWIELPKSIGGTSF